MAIKTPDTWDEYLDLVHQAVYEVDELKACLQEEEELDDVGLYAAFLAPLDDALRRLYDDMIAGRYQFPGDSDLPYMAIVRQHGRQIPFRGLLEVINATHRKGLGSAA